MPYIKLSLKALREIQEALVVADQTDDNSTLDLIEAAIQDEVDTLASTTHHYNDRHPAIVNALQKAGTARLDVLERMVDDALVCIRTTRRYGAQSTGYDAAVLHWADALRSESGRIKTLLDLPQIPQK